MKFRKFLSNPDPAASYAEAVQRLETLPVDGLDEIIPPCQAQFLSHGQKSERAIVFFHGYTACPNQFYKLGTMFHQQGYNVLLPRMPYHGLKDRLTPLQARLTAQDLVRLTDAAIDIARGLGEQVYVMGLSMGGVLAAWAAQYRADLERAMIISPAMAFKAIPYRFTRLAMLGGLIGPVRFQWWDPERQADVPYPPYGYPRYNTRALSQILRLGFAVRDRARKFPPAAQSIVMVTNANDEAVDNRAAVELVSWWRRTGYTNLHTCEFTADQLLCHDLIDPHQPGERTGLVYPVLIDLMTQAMPTRRRV